MTLEQGKPLRAARNEVGCGRLPRLVRGGGEARLSETIRRRADQRFWCCSARSGRSRDHALELPDLDDPRKVAPALAAGARSC
jgi:hypothetical protein